MGRKRWNYIVIFMGMVALCACRPGDEALERALRLAKGNRPELEKVLAHYAGDSLKLEAAKFLIRNMPGHCSYADTSIYRYYHAVDSTVLSMRDRSVWELRDSLEVLTNRFTSIIHGKAVQDVEVMKADYLIANIDTAFVQWQYGPWATHLDFEQFCEYLLPYKVRELQDLDNWREYLKEAYGRNIEELSYCDIYRNSPIFATIHVNKNLRDGMHPNLTSLRTFPMGRMSTWQKIPFGTCGDYSIIGLAAFRSCGIPVACDYTPQWPFRSLGHTWNAVLGINGKVMPFEGLGTDPGQAHKMDEKMAKVYRKVYEADEEIRRLQATEEYVPAAFRSPFIKDVTADYMDCADVDVEVGGEDGRYAYLAVFDNASWVPVCFARIRGGRAHFKDVGRNIVYLPLRYEGNGLGIPAGEPFILSFAGRAEKVVADTLHKQQVTLVRKYPVLPYACWFSDRAVGGVFQAADNPQFRNAKTFHRIKDWAVRGTEVCVPDSCGAYRYWRYWHPDNYVNMAEIYFVNRNTGEFVEGTPIGTDGSKDNNGDDKSRAFDHNLLSFFDAPCTNSYVGMDFGKPVEIGKIFYTGRGDGNSIDIGDMYELFYWQEGRWKSLGRQEAKSVQLEYEQVPTGALFLLRDLTKGHDERIFTYEEGRQVWW